LLILAPTGCASEQPPGETDDRAVPDQIVIFRVAPLVGTTDSTAAAATEWSQNDNRDSIAIEIHAGLHARLNSFEVHAFVQRIDPADIVVDTTGRWVAVRVTQVSDTAYASRVQLQQAFLRPSEFHRLLAEPLGAEEHITRLRVTSRSLGGGIAERTLSLLWPGI